MGQLYFNRGTLKKNLLGSLKILVLVND